MNITEIILKARPTLAPSTVGQYVSNLRKLQNMFSTDNFDFLTDVDEVMAKLQYLHYTSKRNYLNAIIVFLMAHEDGDNHTDIQKYIKVRDEYNEQYAKEQKTGIISDKQSPNFTTIEEVYKMINKMAEELKPIKKKENLSAKEKQLLQVFILFNIHVRLPLRNDLAGAMAINKREYNKLLDADKKENNYLVIDKNDMYFILNKYKTSKKYEELKIIVPKDLKKLLRFYLKIHGTGVLFTSSTGNPLTRNALTQLLTKYSMRYMNKKISTTLLRKIYLSSKYADMNEELEEDNKVMAHSKDVALATYIKKPQEEQV